MDDTRLGVQSAGEENGERGVLHAADRNGTVQTAAARDEYFFHGSYYICTAYREGIRVTEVWVKKGE